MLKKMSFRKIIISSTVLFTLFLLYLVPPNKNETDFNQSLEYVNYNINEHIIFLLDKESYVARTNLLINDNKDIIATAKYLLESLTLASSYESIIPSGFKAIIPSGTKVINLDYIEKEKLIKVDFSSSLLDINKELEVKLIEAIIYTLTSIDNIDKVILYIDGELLTKLPQSNINLPATLDRTFGINKVYDITNYKDIVGTNIYYINKYNDKYYYVPVTKYTNNNQEKIEIIINELSSSTTYMTNLMSFLSNKVELLDVILEEDKLILKFNDFIFDDINSKSILEEVLYTITLSVKDNYNVNEVVFMVEDNIATKIVLKTIE